MSDPTNPRDDDCDRPYTKPIGYLPAYELGRLHAGHDARLRSAKFGPSALDGDVPVYLSESTGARALIAKWRHAADNLGLEGLASLADCADELEAALATPVAARIEVTEEMVTAYLTANDAYWKRTDELPARNPSKWRQGTPSEATRVSLRAALDAVSPADAFVMSTQPHPDGPITLGMLRREGL